MEKTKIQWTDATWNPFYGCRKVSTECKFCYMYRDQRKYGRNPSLVVKSKTKFDEPLKVKEPTLIFTCSWSDWFIEEGDQWRDELWKIIKATPHHTYQILTKRPERIKQCLPADWGKGYDNVWLGVSVGTNEGLERCNILAEVPAKVKFISAEPLLEELTDLSQILSKHKFDWCIIGGESGNNTGQYRFRECKIEWIEKIIQDCKTNDVKVFVKQLGTHLKQKLNLTDKHGGEISEWKQELQIREFPISYKLKQNEKMKTEEGKQNVAKNSVDIIVNGKKIPKNIANAIMPMVELLLDKEKKEAVINGKVVSIETLSPFKMLLAKAILAGEDPKSLAIRVAEERKIPIPTAQAYITMVERFISKNQILQNI